MKKYLLLFFLIPLLCRAQDLLEYKETIKLDSTISQHELMNRLQIWLDDIFLNEQAVIQIMDKENGLMSGKSYIITHAKTALGSVSTYGEVDFKFKIEVKAGKYRYWFFDFYHHNDQALCDDFGVITNEKICPVKFKGCSEKWMQDTWVLIKNDIDREIKAAITSLKFAMNEPSTIDDSDYDW